MSDSPTIRLGEPDDAPALAALAAETFRAAYQDELSGPMLEAYIAEHYGPERQRTELADPRITYLLAESGGRLVGFAMLRTDETDPSVQAERPMMLSQIYLDPAHIGAGLGSRLMERSLDNAAARGHDVVWLGVWERNARAIAFYERWGFEEAGEMRFDFAGQLQRDLVMARPSAGLAVRRA